jgi:cobalt/nickel transport protein
VSAATGRHRASTRVVAAGILLVSLLLAGVVSFYADSNPDGLSKVALDQGFADTETEHAVSGSPFAGYGSSFVDDERAAGGLAGVVGVLVVLAAGSGLAFALRRRSGAPVDDERAAA